MLRISWIAESLLASQENSAPLGELLHELVNYGGKTSNNGTEKEYVMWNFTIYTVQRLHWLKRETQAKMRVGKKDMYRPITVAARSKAWTVYARSNAGIVGSNPTRGMDVCAHAFILFVLSCV
jgi:hypothetical protein